MNHLSAMDDCGRHRLEAWPSDPLLEYRFEAYQMFQEMVNSIQEDTISMLFKVRLEERTSLSQGSAGRCPD